MAKKSEIANFCNNKGLSKPLLRKYALNCGDKYFYVSGDFAFGAFLFLTATKA